MTEYAMNKIFILLNKKKKQNFSNELNMCTPNVTKFVSQFKKCLHLYLYMRLFSIH